MVRDDGREDFNLSFPEAATVWLWIFGPQLALVLILSVLGLVFGDSIVMQNASLERLIQYLAVGPYEVGLAMKAYSGSGLSYGFRYI